MYVSPFGNIVYMRQDFHWQREELPRGVKIHHDSLVPSFLNLYSASLADVPCDLNIPS